MGLMGTAPFSASSNFYRIAELKQIDAADQQIDSPVYELCGLTEEEIKIVEGG
jgi:hypothetical protein